MEFLRTDTFLIFILILNIVLLISSVISNVRIKNIRKNNKEFMKKLGDGKDISEILEKYMDRVVNIEGETRKIAAYYKDLQKKAEKCIQKVGIVRYNAYKDTGSDLSFAIALLDENDDGIVLNGIYSRDTSNIYAKPIENGKSSYTITDEEKQAINIAVNNNKIRKIK